MSSVALTSCPAASVVDLCLIVSSHAIVIHFNSLEDGIAHYQIHVLDRELLLFLVCQRFVYVGVINIGRVLITLV